VLNCRSIVGAYIIPNYVMHMLCPQVLFLPSKLICDGPCTASHENCRDYVAHSFFFQIYIMIRALHALIFSGFAIYMKPASNSIVEGAGTEGVDVRASHLIYSNILEHGGNIHYDSCLALPNIFWHTYPTIYIS
jgi:hypothetical protein